VVGSGHRLSLQGTLHRRHRPDDRLGELADPAVVDESDRDRVEEVALLAPLAPGRDQARLLEHAEVPHDAEPRHRRQVRAQLAERLAIALEEPVEEQAPARVAEGPERRRHRVVDHGPDYM
jgi:hypothetical protein